jgi:hypothetical protein
MTDAPLTGGVFALVRLKKFRAPAGQAPVFAVNSNAQPKEEASDG